MSALAIDAASLTLGELEDVIGRGLETFVEVGAALMEIRDRRLYGQQTFENYCLERWGFSKQYAHLVIAEAKVNQLVDSPIRQSQARELVPLVSEPEAVVAVWEEVQERAEVEQRPVTAALVAEVRDTFTGAAMSSKTDLWSTPQDLFDELNQEFRFALDVCATADNAKCEQFYGKEHDGLAQEWLGTCWMNPPYGDEIGRWVEKARTSTVSGKATVVCLVPARIDTAWWWDNCRYGEVRFLRGRLKFGGGANSAPFPSAVVIFGTLVVPKTVYWER